MSLQAPLFPIDQPVMPEDRQIGRALSIEMLSARIGNATHQWLIGPRRIGKTSVAKAALARLRADGSVALDVDMSKLAIRGEHMEPTMVPRVLVRSLMLLPCTLVLRPLAR
ncbi:MAG: hypothetical protein ACRDK4_03355 [Solirubrobacteraceae bacterium]